ncbi:MAG: T9SS type A sorting domain-containing protein [Bacteroidales bacterium]|nr:T9SS type A sorting domain-containing protein [Bacteroidales bacterium]MCF8404593.1 T9SS type A sorting domain-containing protein [Bacteroidales bacterium]
MKNLLAVSVLISIATNCFAQTTFGPPQVIVEATADQIIAVDVDNDNDLDIVGLQNSNKIFWVENDDEQNFWPWHTVLNSADLSKIFIADVDNDQDMDIVFSWAEFLGFGGVKLLKNDGFGSFGQVIEIIPPEPGYWDFLYISFYMDDVDDDDDLDLIKIQGDVAIDYGSLNLYKNNGAGNYSLSQEIGLGLKYIDNVLTADIDGDNDKDIVCSWLNLSWWENSGGGMYNTTMDTISEEYFQLTSATDLDGDSDIDILVTKHYPLSAIWWENSGNGSFQNSHLLDETTKSRLTADFDNDLDTDILGTSDTGIFWFENNGFGEFSEKQKIFSSDVLSVISSDLDKDGKLDILCSTDEKIYFFDNEPDLYFHFYFEICEGDSLFLANQWISTAGIYTDTLTNILGNDSINVYTIIENPAPPLVEISGAVEVEEYAIETYSVPVYPGIDYNFQVLNGTIINSLNNAVEVQWGSNAMGLVTVVATNTNTECSQESILEVTVGTGAVNVEVLIQGHCYPNPAKDKLYIKSREKDLIATFSDFTGHVMLTSFTNEVDLSSLNNNLYLVRISDRQQRLLWVQKIVVIH